ncbi:MAG: LysR family transcriptional regulator [Oscillospiraceae bacterium]|jgi:DNA-binding transcriptional LysR family regulator
MDTRDWLILQTLSLDKNVTNAAQKLHMTQAALTYRIKNLEREFSCQFFLRTSKGLLLTNQGEIIIEYAKEMLKDYREVTNKLVSMDSNLRGTLHIAVSPAYSKYKLPDILAAFRKKYPNVDIYIRTHNSTHSVELLKRDDVQIAIVRGNHKWIEGKVLLGQEPIVLISNQKVSLKNLPKLPYILYDTDQKLKQEIDDWWYEFFSRPPHTIMTINDSDTCRLFVSKGLGFSILPSISLLNKTYPNLYISPLAHRNKKPMMRSTSLMYRKSSAQILTVEKFIEIACEQSGVKAVS